MRLAFLALFGALAVTSARADDFYAGKTITISVHNATR